MFINTPPITLSCTRTGAAAFPNEQNFTIPTTHDSGNAVKAGDLCVLGDLCNNNNGSFPALVAPSGFTFIGTSTGLQQNGNASRAAMSYKILTAADIGAVRVGMNPTDNARKMLATFEMNRAVQSVVAAGYSDSGPTGGDPLQINVSPIAPYLGTSLVVLMGLGQTAHAPTQSGVIGSQPYNLTADDTGAVLSATRIYYSMYPFGVTPATGAINMGDVSTINSNWSCGCYFFLI